MISALQYTDDAAVPSLTADRLQRSFDVMSETYLRDGRIINTTKTEILSASSPDDDDMHTYIYIHTIYIYKHTYYNS